MNFSLMDGKVHKRALSFDSVGENKNKK